SCCMRGGSYDGSPRRYFFPRVARLVRPAGRCSSRRHALTLGRMTYFDDLEVGVRRLVGACMVSKDESIEFARRWEPQPYHVDERAAAASPYGRLTVCSLHLFAVVTRLFLLQDDPVAVTGMLGKD